MIRRLTEKDHDTVFRLLKTKSAENLFIIGDIEAFGYEQEFQKLWGDFDEEGELKAVLLKYEGNFIPFATGTFNSKGFATIMDNDPDFRMMSGLKHITEQIEPYVKRKLKRKRQTYYAKCTRLDERFKDMDFSDVRQAVPEDVDDLIELLRQIPEFLDAVIDPENKRRNLENGTSRAYFIMEDGKMVSTASTAAENSLSAMVVSVATLEKYKQKGYATKIVAKLCHDLLKEGKELCLFYDNPRAGSIYKKIGFQDIGFWMMYTYE
jgi:uncharacterized protein